LLPGLSIELPAEAVEAIAVRAAELLATRQSRWVYGDKAAAEYLGWPVGRVTKLRQAGAPSNGLQLEQKGHPASSLRWGRTAWGAYEMFDHVQQSGLIGLNASGLGMGAATEEEGVPKWPMSINSQSR
jgi:hypothetical protein